MDEVRVPVLLIVGSLGTGKSDTSYHLFSRLWRSGTPVARLDLDALGMCHPAPENDPDNHRIKAEAMATAWAVFRSHGGGGSAHPADPRRPMDDLSAPHQRRGATSPHRRAWSTPRLRLREHRLDGQGGVEDEAHLPSRTFPDIVLDTHDLDRQEVVDLVLKKTAWPSLG